MPSERIINNLLELPFGPYLEETILSDKCKFIPSRRLLLKDFSLAYNNEPTGFDRTEFDGDLTPSNVSHLPPVSSGARVLFRGVLSVHALAHLSEKGLQYLNHDLRERITRSAVNGVISAKRYNSLDVETIFAWKAKQKDVPKPERYDICVLIQGFMHSTASFMRSDLAPDGLLFHSANTAKNKFRVYEIASMDVETYALSRTFLFRHHTLRSMRDILSASDGVPANMCTPQWFLENYLLHSAYPSQYRWRRINTLDEIESSDEGTSMASEHPSVVQPSDAQTHRPRYLRTVHKNEVWSIFASHSKWILSLIEKHKDLKGKVNAQSWRIFLIQVPQLRQRAVSDTDTAGKWGLLDEQEGNKVRKIPISKIPPPPVPEVVIPQSTTSKNQRDKEQCTATKLIVSATSSPLASSSRAPITHTLPDDKLDNIYDSDFSQESLSPTSYYANSWLPSSADAHSPVDPSLFTLIPYEMLVSPMLPSDLIWHCPIGGGACLYVIDLCTPSDDNLKPISTDVSSDDRNSFLKKEWKSNDEQIYTMFYEMVNAHWEDHLKELDIKHVKQGNTSTFEWIHPQRHRSWPPQEWKRMRTRREQPKSKP